MSTALGVPIKFGLIRWDDFHFGLLQKINQLLFAPISTLCIVKNLHESIGCLLHTCTHRMKTKQNLSGHELVSFSATFRYSRSFALAALAARRGRCWFSGCCLAHGATGHRCVREAGRHHCPLGHMKVYLPFLYAHGGGWCMA